MTIDEIEAEMEKIRQEVQERHKDRWDEDVATPRGMKTLVEILADFNTECEKRIPEWKALAEVTEKS